MTTRTTLAPSVLVTEAVLPLLCAHRPQAIFLQCGADALEEGPLSRLSLSNNAHAEMASRLRDLAAERNIPLIVSGGGGYNPFSTGRCWACVWAALNGIAVPDRAPPAAEAVLRALHYPRAIGRNPPVHWLTTLRDPREVRSTSPTRATRGRRAPLFLVGALTGPPRLGQARLAFLAPDSTLAYASPAAKHLVGGELVGRLHETGPKGCEKNRLLEPQVPGPASAGCFGKESISKSATL